MNNLGLPIIGLGQRTEELSHLPLQWMPHIQVANVNLSVRRAVDLGGSELMHQKAADGTSQWAVLLDPAGAAFGLIPVVPSEALPADDGGEAGAVGRIVWLDLTVADASSIRDFYREVVGWSPDPVELTDGEDRYVDFIMVGGAGEPVAGVCQARGSNLGLPAVWLLYLPVGDIRESLRRVDDEGGRLLKVSRTANGDYHYAVIQDPVGGYAALVPV